MHTKFPCVRVGKSFQVFPNALYRAAHISASWNVTFCLGTSDGVSAIFNHRGLHVWSCLGLRCAIILNGTVIYLEDTDVRNGS